LPAVGDPLERLASVLDFALFRAELDGTLACVAQRFSFSSAPASPSQRPMHLQRQHNPNRAS
jgi:hypothetical protein